MLESVAAEMAADSINCRIQMIASLISGGRFKPGGRQELVTGYENDLMEADRLRMLDDEPSPVNTQENSALALVKVYEMLKQVGVLEP